MLRAFVQKFAASIAVSDGELLHLAQVAAGDDVRALEDLGAEALEELITALLRIQDSALV